MPAPPDGPKDATPITRAQNRALLDALPFDDTQDFEDARRGFLGTLPEAEIRNAQGPRRLEPARMSLSWRQTSAPATVNPSLWRQAQLNKLHGLFQVTDRIYQVRGFDASNMTLIEGERGLIVIDPMISTETARAGLDLYSQHRGQRPVTAVIYTPLPRRSLRRRARRRDRGRRPRGTRRDHRTGPVHGDGRRGERAAGPAEDRRASSTSSAASSPGDRAARSTSAWRRRCHGAPSRSSRRRAPSRSPSRRTGSTASRSCSSWPPRPKRRPRCTCSTRPSGR